MLSDPGLPAEGALLPPPRCRTAAMRFGFPAIDGGYGGLGLYLNYNVREPPALLPFSPARGWCPAVDRELSHAGACWAMGQGQQVCEGKYCWVMLYLACVCVYFALRWVPTAHTRLAFDIVALQKHRTFACLGSCLESTDPS